MVEIMKCESTRFLYRLWHPGNASIVTTVGREILWTAPQVQVGGEEWSIGEVWDMVRLSHRVIVGRLVPPPSRAHLEAHDF